MNLTNLENDFKRTGDLVRALYKHDKINALLRQSYWQTQLVMCSVLLKASPFDQLKTLITTIHRGITQEEMQEAYSKTFRIENLDLANLPDEAKSIYSEALLTGSGCADCALEMTVSTLTHAQLTATDPEVVKQADMALRCIEKHYAIMVRKKAGLRDE